MVRRWLLVVVGVVVVVVADGGVGVDVVVEQLVLLVVVPLDHHDRPVFELSDRIAQILQTSLVPPTS